MATNDLGELREQARGAAGHDRPDWERRQFSPMVINAGFVTGLVLAILCLLIAGWYLVAYREFASEALQQPPAREALLVHLYLARALLQSCGLATGMAFGFLGFSLFLIGVGGNMDASGSSGNVGVQVARISPGAFVMLCSAILVGLCAVSEIPAGASGTSPSDSSNLVDDANAFRGLDGNGSGGNEVDMTVPAANGGGEGGNQS